MRGTPLSVNPSGVDENPTTPGTAGAVRQLPLVLAVTLVVCVLPALVAPRLVTATGSDPSSRASC